MKRLYVLLVIIFLSTFLLSGCNGVAPSTPDDEYDEENTELAYLRIIPTDIKITVNQPKTFDLKAYNSDDKLIAMDIAKFEKWVAMYECVGCGIVWNISPITGSFQTTFTPYKAGRYTVSARYDGKWGQAIVYVE
jgi:hypothetical protein